MNIIDTLSKTQIKNIKTKTFPKNATIFYENDECTSIGIINYGIVSIVSYLENGDEIIYNSLKENDIFGNNLIFSSNPYYKGNVIASSDVSISFISKKELLSILKNNSDFLLHYLNIQSNSSKQLNDTTSLLSLPSALDRLLYYFKINNNIIEYKSVSDLAKKLYIKRETLSRLLSNLNKEKKIIKDKNTIRKV